MQQEPAAPLSKSKEEENPGAKQEAKAGGKEPPEPPVAGLGRQPAESAEQRRGTAGKLEEAGHRREVPGVPPRERKAPQQESDRAAKKAAENWDAQDARNHLEKKPLAEDFGGAKAGRDVQEKNSLKAVEAATAPIQREPPGAAKVPRAAGKGLERDSGADLKAKALSQVEPREPAVAPGSSSKLKVARSEQHPREQRGAEGAEGAGRQQAAAQGHVAGKGQGKDGDPGENAVELAQDPQGNLRSKQRHVEGRLTNDFEKKPSPENAATRGDRRQEHDLKPNRDLKLQADLDLRRRRRELLPPQGEEKEGEDEEEEDEEGAQGAGVLIGLNPLPDVKVNDLRSALETRLSQVAEGAQQVVRSRRLRQLGGADSSV